VRIVLIALLTLAFRFPHYCLDVHRLQDFGQDSTFAWFFVALNVLFIFGDVTGKVEDLPIFLIVASTAYVLLWLYILLTPSTRGLNRFGKIRWKGGDNMSDKYIVQINKVPESST